MPDEKDLNYLQRYLLEEAIEDYQHGHLSRRDALKMMTGVLGSLTAASALLAACAPVAQAPASPTAAPAASQATATMMPPAPTTAPTAAPATRPPATTGPTTAPTAGGTATSAATRVATQAVMTTTATVAAAGTPAPPAGVRVEANDPAIEAADVQFPGAGSLTLIGYLARPKGNGPFPPALVCHENRGLTDHIKDVARRLGKAGYAALAVDLLGRQGGTAKVTDATAIPGLLSNMPREQIVQDFTSGLQYLQGQAFVTKGKAGMVGFCFGGGVTWLCATGIPGLTAAVPFYGPNPPIADVPKIQAAVLAFYGERDQRINAGIPEIEQAMKQAGKTFEKMIYPEANHAFHNDTGANYNPQAAVDAWSRTLAWFDKYVKAA